MTDHATIPPGSKVRLKSESVDSGVRFLVVIGGYINLPHPDRELSGQDWQFHSSEPFHAHTFEIVEPAPTEQFLTTPEETHR